MRSLRWPIGALFLALLLSGSLARAQSCPSTVPTGEELRTAAPACSPATTPSSGHH